MEIRKEIHSKTIDKNRFNELIMDYMEKNFIQNKDVISITEDDRFATLWYWWKP